MMLDLTLAWLLGPLILGFTSYLLPRWARGCTLLSAIASMAYGIDRIRAIEPLQFQLLDHFGVSLLADNLSGYFILTNALVTIAVTLYCWSSDKKAFFYTQLMILHGCINAVFIGADLISVYVALEVISIAAFLLITYARTDRAIWVGLRYLLVSNVAMLFYLMGAILVYQANQSFAFTGLSNAPTEAIALLVLGLLVKGGIFVSGLWLPFTHAEVETPVSAILSGIVIKTGVFPLVRFALVFEALGPMLQLLCAGTAFLGVTLAFLQQDTKRVLALSTISQMGFILVNPATAGIYALSHGLAKAIMFLVAGNLPSRKFADLGQEGISAKAWIPLSMACLSVMGLPGLVGFGAKVMALKPLSNPVAIAMNLAAVGTVIILARFLWLPIQRQSEWTRPQSFWVAIGLPLVLMVGFSGFQFSTYTFDNLSKALITLSAGFIIHGLIRSWVRVKLTLGLERIDHLIGTMSFVLTLLFWLAWL